ncbi:unnamed protein product [Peniophora sp. CBMAI 1063]|nr:unnamed protein product [Peniophora sp. CBMAI 1063]
MHPRQRANRDAPALEARHTRLEKLDINFAREENTFLVAPAGPTGVNWWPYTWEGAQGFATPTTAQPEPTPAQTQDSIPTSTTSSSDPSSTSTSVPTPASSTSSATSFQGSVISASSTASGTSAASVRAVSSTSPFKLYLLAPIIGGVGLTLLAICIVCRRRRHRRHKDTISALEAGPRYETYESKPLFPLDGMQQVSLLRPEDPRGVQRVHANQRPPSHRSKRSKRSTRRPAQPGLAAASRSSHTLGVPELSERPDSPSVYSVPSRGPSRAMTVLSAHPKNAGADESYDSHRHKSIRRGLVERINSEGRRGAGYQAVSDDEDEEEDAMLAYYESGRSPLSAVTARSGPGFRIVQEDPPSPSALHSEASSSWLAWTRGWSASNLNIAEQAPPASGHSHFTPKPMRRRDRTSGSSSGAVTPTARTPTHSRPPSRTTTPARSRPASRTTSPARNAPPRVPMLPASPPLVSSPQFNAALTFGGPDPSAQPTTSPRRKARATSPSSRETAREHQSRRSTRDTKLPYPGDVEGEDRRRGREQRKKTSPEREHALDEVDAIVARSIVQKRVASEESELAGWTSIQQRLEALA